jgi:hypothetical protein
MKCSYVKGFDVCYLEFSPSNDISLLMTYLELHILTEHSTELR